jgi:alanine racemase
MTTRTTRPSQPLRPCWLEINTRSLQENYRFLRSLAGPTPECLAIVKANAYGHDLSLCAPAAVEAGARWLGVTSVEEGVAARAVCPDARIVVMGGLFPGQAAAVFEHSLTPVIWEPWQLDELENHARAKGPPAGSMPVHLEIDTGMSRQGASPNDLPALLARFTPASSLRLEAVMTHLYASDEAQGETTFRQLEILNDTLTRVRSVLPTDVPGPDRLSVGASAALLGGEATEIVSMAARQELIPILRLGLALYGVTPRFDPSFQPLKDPPTLTLAAENLQPVLTWKTRITSLRSIPAGAEVGYNGTFVATEPMRLALLPLGYADGLDRRLGNRFSLLVRGQRAPLVGRISMDQSVLDVTEIPGVAPGDEVVIIGSQNGDTITAFEHADATGTHPWDIFTRIAARVTRVGV